jgi:hypothetical protein
MRWVVLLSCVALSGCAGVEFQQLDPKLAKKTDAPAGAVYYLPKPYLLVAQMPVAAAAAPAPAGPANVSPPPQNTQGQNAQGQNGQGPQAGNGQTVYPATYGRGGADGDEAKADAKDDGGAPTASGSDQSFGGVSQGYMIKLVYLPDMSRPMAFSVTAGLGSASLKPTLQNGWMLSGFDATADSKTAEILTSLASVITAYKTPGKAAAAEEKAADGGGSGTRGGEADARPILKPGLYEFRYDATTGALKGLCPVTYFTDGVATPAATPAGC